jgi:hypothetical protein
VFYKLVRASADVYGWTGNETTLEPHVGYAYHFQPGEILTLDPWKSTAVLPKQSTGYSSTTASHSSFRTWISFAGSGAESTIELLPNGKREEEIPWLGVPGGNVDFKVGASKGYFRKSIAYPALTELPVRIRTSKPQKSSWNFFPGALEMRAILVDSVLGIAYAPGDSILSVGGEQHLTLWLGSGTEISEKEGVWKSSLPSHSWIRIPSLIRSNQAIELKIHWLYSLAQAQSNLEVTLINLAGEVVYRESITPRVLGDQSWKLSWHPQPGLFGMVVRATNLPGHPVHIQKLTVLP